MEDTEIKITKSLLDSKIEPDLIDHINTQIYKLNSSYIGTIVNISNLCGVNLSILMMPYIIVYIGVIPYCILSIIYSIWCYYTTCIIIRKEMTDKHLFSYDQMALHLSGTSFQYWTQIFVFLYLIIILLPGNIMIAFNEATMYGILFGKDQYMASESSFRWWVGITVVFLYLPMSMLKRIRDFLLLNLIGVGLTIFYCIAFSYMAYSYNNNFSERWSQMNWYSGDAYGYSIAFSYMAYNYCIQMWMPIMYEGMGEHIKSKKNFQDAVFYALFLSLVLKITLGVLFYTIFLQESQFSIMFNDLSDYPICETVVLASPLFALTYVPYSLQPIRNQFMQLIYGIWSEDIEKASQNQIFTCAIIMLVVIFLLSIITNDFNLLLNICNNTFSNLLNFAYPSIIYLLYRRYHGKKLNDYKGYSNITSLAFVTLISIVGLAVYLDSINE